MQLHLLRWVLRLRDEIPFLDTTIYSTARKVVAQSTMDDQDSQWVQQRVFLFSHPRTASNLLMQMLSGQSQWQVASYHHLDSFQFLRETAKHAKDMAELGADVEERHDMLLRQAREKLQESLESAAREVRDLFFSIICVNLLAQIFADAV